MACAECGDPCHDDDLIFNEVVGLDVCEDCHDSINDAGFGTGGQDRESYSDTQDRENYNESEGE